MGKTIEVRFLYNLVFPIESGKTMVVRLHLRAQRQVRFLLIRRGLERRGAVQIRYWSRQAKDVTVGKTTIRHLRGGNVLRLQAKYFSAEGHLIDGSVHTNKLERDSQLARQPVACEMFATGSNPE